MAFQQFNYENYLDQNKLKEAHRFQPLFEAIENAFNAVEERIEEDVSFSDGYVEIRIRRSQQQVFGTLAKSSLSPAEIVGFSVIDNGVGFRPKNWNAYEEVYTSYKKSKGGKGVGRLSYLQAFASAEVRSVYTDNGKYYERTFRIVRSQTGTDSETNVEIEYDDQITAVHLESFDLRLRRGAPKVLEAIARQLTEHFFKRLSVDSKIRCVIKDDWDGRSIDLKSFCSDEMVIQKKEDVLEVGSHMLRITHTKCKTRVADKHEIHLCADGRVVSTYNVGIQHIPSKQALQSGDTRYFYLAFVEGSLLDKEATQDRLGFTLPNEIDDEADKLDYGDAGLPSIAEIIDAVGASAREYLKSDIDPLVVQHRKRIEELCRANVIYRPLLTQRMPQLMQIPINLSDADLEQAIWRVYHDWKADVRTRFNQLAKTVRENTDDLKIYRANYREALRNLNQMAVHELALYVIDRRAVIDFLWDRLAVSSSGRFQDEDAIHDIFFPRKQTSSDIAWDESNLWLIDERLAFQQFASSDLPLREHMPASESYQRPDVNVLYDRVFDGTFAFTDGQQTPFTSVTLVEFKRPERKNYDEKENPVAQAVRYIKEMRAKKVFTHEGHTFRITENTPIHVHVICHIVDELKAHVDIYNPIVTPDGEGLIMYLTHYKAYIEVTSFEKLIADARKRNEAFFQKLGIDRTDWKEKSFEARGDQKVDSCQPTA